MVDEATMNGFFLENENKKSSTSLLRYVDYKSFHIKYESEQEDHPQNLKGAQVALITGNFWFIFWGDKDCTVNML